MFDASEGEGVVLEFSAGPDAHEARGAKPYEWRLAERENPEMIALPARQVAERSFVKLEAFRSVLERTAAFLVVVSRNNGYEGRDPLLITDDVRSGAVSSFLGIELDVLARALVEMQRRGMISPAEDGNLRLVDLSAIDSLSNGDTARA